MKIIRHTCTIVFLLFLYACIGPRYYTYSPVPAPAPFFTSKNNSTIDVQATSSLEFESGHKDKSIGVKVNAAYALTNHFAITTSFDKVYQVDNYSRNWNDGVLDYDSNSIRYHKYLWEAGIGYFTRMGESKTFFNIYAGIGLGKDKVRDQGWLADNKLPENGFHNRIQKFWLQPALHFISGKRVSFGVGTRLVLLKHQQVSTSFTQVQLDHRDLQSIGRRSFFYVEPHLNTRMTVYPKWLSVNIGLGFCPSVQTDNDVVNDKSRQRNRYVIGSLGLSFDLHKISIK